MPLIDYSDTRVARLQRNRSEQFGAKTSKKIQAAKNCPFSLLPLEELARQASGWYEACGQTMLQGNNGPIITWIDQQSRLAQAQGFTHEDIVQLLRICRDSAIESEGWSEEYLSSVDEIIGEIFKPASAGIASPVREKTASSAHAPIERQISTKVSEPERAERPASTPAPQGKHGAERRDTHRNRLQIPIRVRGMSDHGAIEEITHTENISRGGLYFSTREDYGMEQTLKITYPYWTESAAINSEYSAQIVRLDQLQDGRRGVAVKFLKSQGRKG